MTTSRESIGATIARLRADRQMTQGELGSLAGLGQTVLSRIETGERRLDAVELVALAEALDVSASLILEEAQRLDQALSGVDVVAMRFGEDAELRDAFAWMENFFDQLERLENLTDDR